MADGFEHEELRVVLGRRCGWPVAVAVHSTVLGQALGGCRVKAYADWRDGVEDALRLSWAMTQKITVAGLPNGGGKTVVALPPGTVLDAGTRRAVLLDVGDAIEALGGRYATGPDVGTGPDDMVTIAERTGYVCCRPAEVGGSGDSGPHTADGVDAAIRATLAAVTGSPDPAGRRVTVIGLGSVGGRLAARLAAAGARLTVAEVDPDRPVPDGATRVPTEAALTTEADVLVPAALGGLLTAEVADRLRCRAVVGPANNQLADPSVAARLHRRGIVWVPDHVASAGGVVYASGVELRGETHERAAERVEAIGATTARLLAATTPDRTPLDVAGDLVAERLAAAGPEALPARA